MGAFVKRFMDPKRSLAMGIPFLILGILLLTVLWSFLMGDPNDLDDGVVKYKGTVEEVNTEYDKATEIKVGKYYYFIDSKTDNYKVGTSVIIWRVDKKSPHEAREWLWKRDSQHGLGNLRKMWKKARIFLEKSETVASLQSPLLSCFSFFTASAPM